MNMLPPTMEKFTSFIYLKNFASVQNLKNYDSSCRSPGFISSEAFVDCAHCTPRSITPLTWQVLVRSGLCIQLCIFLYLYTPYCFLLLLVRIEK